MFLEGLDNMHARIIDPDYSILFSENTTTHSWQTIWPEFVIVYDLDGEYWYYLAMNDLRDQVSSTWHESDWEHISIKISENAGVFTPVKVDFYLHEGGRSFTANDCWWSSTNSLSYGSIQEGYDENHTNLNVWIAANSHASYNRYSLVYKITGSLFGISGKTYQDRVDYLPAGFDLYFGYDNLVKLGEVSKQANVECPESGYTYEFHSYRIGNTSKYWSAYRGRTGIFTGDPGQMPPSPFMPAKGDGHEWLSFTENGYFGNDGLNYILLDIEVLWYIDNSLGD